MNKKIIIELVVAIILVIILVILIALYVKNDDTQNTEFSNNTSMGTPPDKPNGNFGQPGENSESSNVSHIGATEISSDTTNSEKTYSSTTASENALLVTSGTSTLNAFVKEVRYQIKVKKA